MRGSWISVLGIALGTGIATGCASSFDEPAATPAGAAADAAMSDEEHLAALEAIPDEAVRLIEGPFLALQHWEYLDLTVDQLRRLEDLDLLVRREREGLLLGMEAARQELAAATNGPFDEVRIRAALDEVAAARTEASVLTLRAREQTLALLTAEQASLLDGFAREHVHMMMMGWVTEVCMGASGTDALVSDATGAMTPCIAMPDMPEGAEWDPLVPHVH
jgi:Spy/CpxP family protein refolding chaperone